MNAPVKIVLDDSGAVTSVVPLHAFGEPELSAPEPREPDPKDPDWIRRQELLARLRDDRADLVRVAKSVREIAETVETAQSTLAFTRRSVRWLLLAGSAAALTMWVTSASGRRPRSALVAGLSMQLLRRWIGPSSFAKQEKLLARADHKHRLLAPSTARAGPV